MGKRNSTVHVDAVGNSLLDDLSKNVIFGVFSKPGGGSLSAPVKNIKTSWSVQSHSPPAGYDKRYIQSCIWM